MPLALKFTLPNLPPSNYIYHFIFYTSFNIKILIIIIINYYFYYVPTNLIKQYIFSPFYVITTV